MAKKPAASSAYLGHEAHNRDEIIDAYNRALQYRKSIDDAIARAKTNKGQVTFKPITGGSGTNRYSVSDLQKFKNQASDDIGRMDAALRSIYKFTPMVLNNRITNVPAPQPDAQAAPPAAPAPAPAPAASGGGGQSVRQLQQELKNAGFDPGPIDGIMGPKTRAAIAARDRGNSGPPPASSSAAPAGGLPAMVPGQTDEESIKAFLRANYGYLAAFYDDPEIGPVLREAAQWDWDDARLQGRLFQTQWWQKTSQTARQFEALQKTDPATAQQQIQQKLATIGQLATRMGSSITADRLQQLATDSIKFGWGDTEINQALATEIHYNPNIAQQGQVGDFQARIKAMSGDWMVNISDHTAFDLAKQMVAGTTTQEGITQYLRSLALGKFPSLKDAIETQGMTVKQLIDPYREDAARILEMQPAQIDFLNDPQFANVLNYTDPKTGKQGLMNSGDFQTYVRGLDRFKTTKQANQQKADLLTMMGQTFGALAS